MQFRAGMVGARGFEPPASRSRTVRSTKLSYAPRRHTANAREPTPWREPQGYPTPASAVNRALQSKQVLLPIRWSPRVAGRSGPMTIQTLAELFLTTAGHAKAEHLLHKVDGQYTPIS